MAPRGLKTPQSSSNNTRKRGVNSRIRKTKMKGTLIYWNARKFFGIVEVKTRQDIGWRIDKYFLHASQIKFQTVEQIHESCWVRFELRNRPAKPGLLPDAGSAEVFESLKELLDSEKGSEGSAL
jgi:hypothetical protein